MSVRTKSPMMMLYYRLFRGLRVNCMLRRPVVMVLGVCLYRTTYVLTGC